MINYRKFLDYSMYFVVASLGFIPLLSMLTGNNLIKDVFVNLFWANPNSEIWEFITIDVVLACKLIMS